MTGDEVNEGVGTAADRESPETPITAAGAAERYAQVVQDEIATQEQRKASFEQRGMAVITTSGVLATLLFGLAALSNKPSVGLVIPNSAHVWLVIALALFAASAFAALLINLPVKYQSVEPAEIRARLDRARDEAMPDEWAVRDIAITRLKELGSAKRINGVKGWLLVSALALEAGAVICLAAAVSQVL